MTINCGRLTNNNIDAALKFLPVFEQEGYQFEEGFICNFNWPNWQAVAERYYRQADSERSGRKWLMAKIKQDNKAIDAHGSWPDAFVTKGSS